MIPFNVPPYAGTEENYIKTAINNRKICGDGEFTKKCNEWLEKKFNAKKVLLTTSGTSALEIAALLCNLQPNDEVIMPSYTFCSTANAFVQRGCKIVFVDIRPDTMNINEKLIERAITSRTKVIVAVHYAGIACEMDEIMTIAKKYNLKVVEDAAQGVMSYYKGKSLGTIGDYGCFSFHETKNYSMGEGGAIVINTTEEDVEKAEIIREKGTNRSKYFRGQIDKYTWVDYGSSYLPSDLNAAYLWAQLEIAEKINNTRLNIWNKYFNSFSYFVHKNYFELPSVPCNCIHNAHMFYLKCKNLIERTDFISYMKNKGINCSFHYIPLHSSPAGIKYGAFYDKDIYTTKESERLVRLPLWYGMSEDELNCIINTVLSYWR